MNREFEITINVNTKYKYEAFDKIKKMLKDNKMNAISIKCLEKRRSSQQNRALHLYFTLLADELNSAGFDMKKVFKKEFDIPWDAYNIKEHLWRGIQKAFTGKISNKKLSTQELDKIYDILNKTIGERTGVFVPFPNMEELMRNKETIIL